MEFLLNSINCTRYMYNCIFNILHQQCCCFQHLALQLVICVCNIYTTYIYLLVWYNLRLKMISELGQSSRELRNSVWRLTYLRNISCVNLETIVFRNVQICYLQSLRSTKNDFRFGSQPTLHIHVCCNSFEELFLHCLFMFILIFIFYDIGKNKKSSKNFIIMYNDDMNTNQSFKWRKRRNAT